MSKSGKPTLSNSRDELLDELKSLEKQIYRKQLELDVLNKAAEIVKKSEGIDPRKLANKEKLSLIDALRMEYPLNELLQMAETPKSSYFYQKATRLRPDKYAFLRADVKIIFFPRTGAAMDTGACMHRLRAREQLSLKR